MRLARVVPLAAPLLLIAATCVTSVEQKDPEGPWIGDVVNLGNQTIYGAGVVARIYDAEGFDLYANVSGFTCPSKLLPGERGAFELFAYSEDYPPSFKSGTPTPPFRAEVFRTEEPPVGTGQARGDGMLVKEIEKIPSERRIRVELWNNSDALFAQFSVCAVIRGNGGKPLEVARADSPGLPYHLFPGEKIDLDLLFNSFPDGTIEYHALGLWDGAYPSCCPVNGASTWRSVDTGPFSVLVPPGWVYDKLQGIDSIIGAFTGDGVEVSFDYHDRAGSPMDPSNPAETVIFETIAGRTARIALSDRIFSLYVDGLNVSARNLTPSQKDTVLQIFRSVRFDAP